jgi:hypothetical protein
MFKQHPRILGNGMWIHIDNLRRSDATVFTVGVEVVYDITRVIDRKKGQEVSMIRSSNPEGTIVVLDEGTWYKWGHAVPPHAGKMVWSHQMYYHSASFA